MSGLFVPLEASYTEDPKIQSVSEHAELMFVRGLAYCKLHWQTDGFIHDRAVVKIAPFGDTVMPQEMISELEAAGLWERVPNGWRVAAWLKHNPPSDEIEEKRRKDSERKAAWRRKRDAETDASRDSGTATPRDADATDSYTQAQAEAQSSSSSDDDEPITSQRSGDEMRRTDLPRERKVELALRFGAWSTVDDALRAGKDINDRRAYTAACYRQLRTDFAAALHKAAHEHPEWSAVDLLTVLDERWDEWGTEDATVVELRPKDPQPCTGCGWEPGWTRPHGQIHAEWLAEVVS